MYVCRKHGFSISSDWLKMCKWIKKNFNISTNPHFFLLRSSMDVEQRSIVMSDPVHTAASHCSTVQLPLLPTVCAEQPDQHKHTDRERERERVWLGCIQNIIFIRYFFPHPLITTPSKLCSILHASSRLEVKDNRFLAVLNKAYGKWSEISVWRQVLHLRGMTRLELEF